MRNLYIIGAGGFGREVAWLVERINLQNPTWKLSGFIDDNLKKQGCSEGSYPIVGTCESLIKSGDDCYAVCAIGSPDVRKKVIERFKDAPSIRFATLIDPSVLMSESVQIGTGSIICARSILTVNVKLGNYAIVNLDCTIGHDVEFGDYLTAYPNVNISGNVCGGNLVEIGTGTQIRQGINLSSNLTIGAGSVVIKNITEPGTYVGVPAKGIKQSVRV